MSVVASQITGSSTACSISFSGWLQTNANQYHWPFSSTLCESTRRWLVDSSHKGPASHTEMMSWWQCCGQGVTQYTDDILPIFIMYTRRILKQGPNVYLCCRRGPPNRRIGRSDWSSWATDWGVVVRGHSFVEYSRSYVVDRYSGSSQGPSTGDKNNDIITVA